MDASKTVLSVAAAALVLVSGSQSRGLDVARAPQPHPPARPAPAATMTDNVVIVEVGKGVDAALAAHAFVVVRRGDGSVPRAYLWDEPLGCPESGRE